jgi:hypothetical protein
VLGLKPAAFRQRLTALRRALGNLPEPLRGEALALTYAAPRRAGEPRLDVGLIRRALLHHLRASGDLEKIFETMLQKGEASGSQTGSSPFSEITDDDIDALFSE